MSEFVAPVSGQYEMRWAIAPKRQPGLQVGDVVTWLADGESRKLRVVGVDEATGGAKLAPAQ